MGLFGSGDKPQRYFGARMNQSEYGKAVPVVMGTAQVEQSLFWIDGFSSQKVSAKGGGGGGKGGGGKGGQYLYSADVIAALCAGKIQGIGDVWSGQSWLGSPTASEAYTITTPYTYTPTQATSLNQNMGVSTPVSVTATYNDVASTYNTVINGVTNCPFTQVNYGNTLASGEYSINPTGNVYNFSSADNGKQVQVAYSFNLTNINRQENDIIPNGLTISVTGTGGGSTVNGDLGVRYASGVNEGNAFTRVTSPSSAGQYSVTGSNPAVYHFNTADKYAEVTISYTVNDPNIVPSGETTSLNFTLNNGTQGQSPYAFLTSSYPGAAFGYTGIATLLYQPMDLGMGAEVQENKFEVVSYDVFGGGVQDCNPVQCIGQVLTNSTWGLGMGTIPFPTQCLDSGASGTWGSAPATSGTNQSGATAWNWFAANSFFISPVIDSQDSAASHIGKWLEAGMCAAYFSEGLLKLVPYGDTSANGNGCTWVAPQSFAVSLDDTCFVAKEGEDPVKITRIAAHDAWNVTQVSWDNRLNQYASEITQESDSGLIARWGERREDVQSWDFIHTLPAAAFAANMRLKHGAYIRNTYEFTLPYGYSYLEPMDVCPISTTSSWAVGLNNVSLGIVNMPVRITKIVDDPVKGLEITAEDYPWGAHQPTIYNKQLAQADVVANAYADPGNSEVVMFEATSRMTGYSGNEIWIGALGTSSMWGSCNIWVSQDGTTYKQIGTIETGARLGELDSTFASGSDPDTVNSLVVDLAENCAALEAGTTTDADYGNTLCFVDGEIISYSAATMTGQNQVTMGTYIRRGQMNSTIGSHAAGSLFLRLDESIFKYTYDPTWAGKTLHFKFQSVNAFGLMSQQLSSLTAVSFTIPGNNPGTIDASSGLIINAGPQKPVLPTADPTTLWIGNGAGPLGWTPSA